jgi:hypothetical protein
MGIRGAQLVAVNTDKQHPHTKAILL